MTSLLSQDITMKFSFEHAPMNFAGGKRAYPPLVEEVVPLA